ncbi:MAG: tyrosine-type recombinase/integrase [Planctomycetota bacterium]|nr:tyrosine-type recombinase/integrase [Planctomycetota bacterium]
MMDRTKRRLDLAADRKEIIGFHVLRHTCASLLRQAGVDLPDVGRIMGHRCLQTTLRYAHLWADGTKKGVKKLGEVLDLSGKKKRRRKGKA